MATSEGKKKSAVIGKKDWEAIAKLFTDIYKNQIVNQPNETSPLIEENLCGQCKTDMPEHICIDCSLPLCTSCRTCHIKEFKAPIHKILSKQCTRVCGQCEKSKPEQFCKTCVISLCAACKDIHLKLPSIRGHNLQPCQKVFSRQSSEVQFQNMGNTGDHSDDNGKEEGDNVCAIEREKNNQTRISKDEDSAIIDPVALRASAKGCRKLTDSVGGKNRQSKLPIKDEDSAIIDIDTEALQLAMKRKEKLPEVLEETKAIATAEATRGKKSEGGRSILTKSSSVDVTTSAKQHDDVSRISRTVGSKAPTGTQESTKANYDSMHTFRCVDMDLMQMAVQRVTKDKEYKLQHENSWYQRMCYLNNQILCPSYYTDKVSVVNVYNLDCKLEKSIKISNIRKAMSLHPLNSEQVLLAAESGLYVMDVSGESDPTRIMKGEFFDVHISENKIAALGQTSVYFLSTNSPFKQISHFEHKCGLAYTVLLQGRNVYISSAINQNVRKYTQKGELLAQYGSFKRREQPGGLHWPFLCAIDSRGSVLVADHENHRLQVVNAKGEWNELKGVKLRLPMDVLVVDNSIYICQRLQGGQSSLQKCKIR